MKSNTSGTWKNLNCNMRKIKISMRKLYLTKMNILSAQMVVKPLFFLEFLYILIYLRYIGFFWEENNIEIRQPHQFLSLRSQSVKSLNQNHKVIDLTQYHKY